MIFQILSQTAGSADDSFIYEDDSLSCAGSFSGRSLPTLPRASASINRQESLGLRSETGRYADIFTMYCFVNTYVILCTCGFLCVCVCVCVMWCVCVCV